MNVDLTIKNPEIEEVKIQIFGGEGLLMEGGRVERDKGNLPALDLNLKANLQKLNSSERESLSKIGLMKLLNLAA